MKFRAPKHKFRAIRCESDGIKFDSKLERAYYQKLVADMKSSDPKVCMFLRQVPFHIPGCKYVADFMVFYLDGNCEVVDCKGIDTPMSKTKRKAVEQLYPITIKIVTREHVGL